MDYSIADYAVSMDPRQTTAYQAEVEKRRQRADQQQALAAANAQTRQFDQLAGIAPLLQNEGILKATLAAQKAAQNLAPEKMGNQGFMLPETGEFVESPMYVDEKNAARAATAANQQARLDAQASEGRERRFLTETLGRLYEQGRNERAAEGFALRRTLAELAAGKGAGEKADKAAAKATADLEKNVTKYSATLEKAGVPEFDSALETAEKRLSMHKPGEMPGYGRFAGAIPNAALPAEGQMARSDMQAAANILLKSRSGAAVTDSEMRRFLTEVASGAGMTEEALRNGWKNVRRVFDAKRGSIAAGVGPDVHDEFIGRGGKDFRINLNAPQAKPAAAGDLTPEEQAELAALKKRLKK
jgi:hypothetical protein